MMTGLTSPSKSISLRDLFPSASFVGCADIFVQHATADSRQCLSGSLFALLPGSQAHGEFYLSNAIARGAKAILTERVLPHVNLPQCVLHHSVRSGYGSLCHALLGNPAQKLSISAVTGTNGKTTTAWLIRTILKEAGIQCGFLGTIEYNDGLVSEKSTLTTPSPEQLAEWFQRMVTLGTTHVAMEVSSHALAQQRVAGIEFETAVLTNITHDHLEYHKTPEAYVSAKQELFRYCKPTADCVVNLDDPVVRQFSKWCPSRFPALDENGTFHFHSTDSQNKDATLWAETVRSSFEGTEFIVEKDGSRITMKTSLLGEHNVSNILAAIGAVSRYQIPLTTIAKAIESVTSIPGRMEQVESCNSIRGIVDYAHTPDALRNAIQSLKKITAGRLILVFGAGGDRDRQKRPMMGRIAQMADVAILTNDNPRNEVPVEIANEVISGCDSSALTLIQKLDREEAIRYAVNIAEPGDSVLVAGKGHERTQMIGHVAHHFDDWDILRTAIQLSHTKHAVVPQKISA